MPLCCLVSTRHWGCCTHLHWLRPAALKSLQIHWLGCWQALARAKNVAALAGAEAPLQWRWGLMGRDSLLLSANLAAMHPSTNEACIPPAIDRLALSCAAPGFRGLGRAQLPAAICCQIAGRWHLQGAGVPDTLTVPWTGECEYSACVCGARTLDGDTNQVKRQAHIDDFNNSPSVFIFLITTGAGGVGINLTAANKWVLHAGACKQHSVLVMLQCLLLGKLLFS